MKLRLGLELVLCLGLLAPTSAWAQDDEQKDDQQQEEAGGDSGGFDPWEAPQAREEKPTEAGEGEQEQSQEQAGAPEVVLPGTYPTAEIDRPLALPPMTLEPRLDLVVDFFTPSGLDNFFSMRLGAGMGIVDDIEAGLTLALSFAPKVYAGMEAYGLYEFSRLWDNRLAWAGRLRLFSAFSKNYLPFHGATSFTLLADAPAKLKLHDMFAVLAAVGMGASINADRPDYFLLYLDLGVLVQPLEALALTWRLQVWGNVGSKSDAALPMLIGAQYTLVGDLDVFVHFGFMDLTEGADWLQLLFGACYRIGL